MLSWIARLIAAGGYWAIAALMALQNIVLPLPSELIMPLAGHDASNGKLSIVGVIIAGTVGSVLGSLPIYLPARLAGKGRVMKWIARHGRWVLLTEDGLKKTQDRFDKRGGVFAVFIAQILPGARSLLSLHAGFARMNVVVFLAANFLGTVIWCTALAIAGRLLGAEFMKVDKWLGPTGWILLVVIAAGVIGWLARRRKHRHARRR